MACRKASLRAEVTGRPRRSPSIRTRWRADRRAGGRSGGPGRLPPGGAGAAAGRESLGSSSRTPSAAVSAAVARARSSGWTVAVRSSLPRPRCRGRRHSGRRVGQAPRSPAARLVPDELFEGHIPGASGTAGRELLGIQARTLVVNGRRRLTGTPPSRWRRSAAGRRRPRGAGERGRLDAQGAAAQGEGDARRSSRPGRTGR